MQQIAVVGAGAIAQQAYLPAIQELPNANLRWVVDIDADRAKGVAAEFGAYGHTTSYDTTLGDTDIAIVATPPKFHSDISQTYLQAGVHVFTEKPIAPTDEVAAELVSLADKQGLQYGISRQQREAPACQLLHRFVNNGALGEIEEFHVQFGDKTAWDFASDYRVNPSLAEGGVLTDKGPHVLDIALWLFGDEFTVERYQDDSFGGLEANAIVELSFEPSGLTGTLEIAGSREIDHEFRITGTAGEITVDPGGSTGTLKDFEADATMQIGPSEKHPNSYLFRVGKQTKRFIDAVETGEGSYVTAASGLWVIELIERCYDSREQIRNDWEMVGIDNTEAPGPKMKVPEEQS